MAAKKKSNSSAENNKNKKGPAKGARGKSGASKPKNEELPKDPEMSDDDFGLDDIELEPVEESSEDTPTPEPIIDPVDEIEDDSTPEPEKKEEEKEEVAPFVYTTGEEKAHKETEPTEGEKPAQEEKKNNSGIVALLVILLILIIAAALYFFVFKKDEPKPEPKKVEQPKVVDPQPEPEPEPEPQPVKPKAELFTISAPEGRWYVVVGSFYDVDLAEDKASSIVASGMSAYLLSPTGDFKFHRVGIAQSANMKEAENKRSELVATYGENIWVLKY